jgi:RNA polymerase sigma-70 factor (ECF subfamily)
MRQIGALPGQANRIKPGVSALKEWEGKPVENSAASEQTERDLIARAQQGDKQAFGELVLRHRQGVINVVYRMCGDANLAEDVAQDAFVRAWQHLCSYRPHSPFRNWVYRIAANAALDVLRAEKETADVDSLPLPATGDGPDALAERNERAEAVRRAVMALPPSSRAALVLREYEGLQYQEIADVLGIPIGTVMSRLSYARGRMAELLAPHLEAP